MFPNILENFDPEINYLDDFQNSIQCNEFSVQEFSDTLKNCNNCMLNIVNFNVRSFGGNKNYFLPIIENAMPEVFVATETWFTESYQADIDN